MANSLGSLNNFIYKAYGSQGATILIPNQFSGKVKDVKYVTDQGEINTQFFGGPSSETGAMKFNFNKSPEELRPGKILMTLDDGTTYEQDITNPLQDFRNGQATAPQSPNSGPGGGGFAPGSFGGSAAYPSYLGGMFPGAVMSDFDPVGKTKYNFVDPTKFAQKYGDFNRDEIRKNFDLSQDIALQELTTELAGLSAFSAAAGALKRGETAIDNKFNQEQRDAQINAVLPGAREALAGQTDRAQAYAQGRLPNAVEDRAFELGIRSASADNSFAGGFGAQSSVARKASDLLSASERVNLSKYGDQLLSQSIGNRASLLLAPTEYSDSGSQIKVTPTVDAGTRTTQVLGEVNQQTVLPVGQAFQGQIQQEQFQTNRESARKEFNAGNMFAASQFNASAQNQFGLAEFGYNVGYAGTVAGAQQTAFNTQFGVDQQKQQQQIFQDYLSDAQSSNQLGSLFGLGGTILGAIFGGGPAGAGIGGTLGSLLGGLFGGGDTGAGGTLPLPRPGGLGSSILGGSTPDFNTAYGDLEIGDALLGFGASKDPVIGTSLNLGQNLVKEVGNFFSSIF